MSKVIIYILLLPFSVFAQNSICSIKIEDTTNSFGLRFKISAPCNWQKGSKDRNVIRLGYNINDTTFVCLLSVKDLGSILTKDDIDLFFTKKYIQDSGFNAGIIPGKLISTSRRKINGYEGGEIIIKESAQKNGTQYWVYLMQSIIIYKDKEIILTYGTAARTEILAKSCFEKYEKTFREWAKQMEFTANKFKLLETD